MNAVQFSISDQPIAPSQLGSAEHGAEIRFLGIVRDTENGQRISGITYSAYLPMAEQVLARIVDAMQAKHGPHPIYIHHRIGFVPVGEPSIVIVTAGKHSAETFERIQSYLQQIKTEVPIWKKFETDASK